ncbi:hypothetical protein E4T56_gene7768 [Termitomyces sp. T112]|nr:hypothetical protein E4T56_gene7768 [Termitomyces sp. T112]
MNGDLGRALAHDPQDINDEMTLLGMAGPDTMTAIASEINIPVRVGRVMTEIGNLTEDGGVEAGVEVLRGKEDVRGRFQNPEQRAGPMAHGEHLYLAPGQETEIQRGGAREIDAGRRLVKRDRDSKRSESKERRKERKREKKEKKKRKHGSGPQWGKYGIISETDIFSKGPEFHAWLVEERKINPETISKDQNKKEFLHFVEDFNTATLPHEKYYHMEAYERRMTALRQGEFIPPADDAYDPQADLKAISGAHKKKTAEQETYLSKERLQELRRVQQERVEAGKMKLLGMDIKQNMGVRMDGTMFDD